jgi:hypothetical protein
MTRNPKAGSNAANARARLTPARGPHHGAQQGRLSANSYHTGERAGRYSAGRRDRRVLPGSPFVGRGRWRATSCGFALPCQHACAGGSELVAITRAPRHCAGASARNRGSGAHAGRFSPGAIAPLSSPMEKMTTTDQISCYRNPQTDETSWSPDPPSCMPRSDTPHGSAHNDPLAQPPRRCSSLCQSPFPYPRTRWPLHSRLVTLLIAV